MWKMERGLEVLTGHDGAEAAVQLLLCSRRAHHVELLQRAERAYRGIPQAARNPLFVDGADAPSEDLAEYFAIALERAMVQGTRLRAAEVRASVQREHLSRVVWGVYEGRKVVETFRPADDEAALFDHEWEVVELDDDAVVGVVHPREVDDGTREAWGMAFAESQVVELFEQFDRVHVPAVRTFPYRSVGRDARHWELVRFLYRHDPWTRDRESRDFRLEIRGATLAMRTRISREDFRTIEGFTLRRSALHRSGLEEDIIYSEALAAAVKVLEAFAPDLL